VHPYITKLVAEQRTADLRATADAYRLARAAKVSSSGSTRRTARHVPWHRTAPQSDSPVAAQLAAPNMAAQTHSGPDSQLQSALADDRDAELCSATRR
jgi:hypothetical protein